MQHRVHRPELARGCLEDELDMRLVRTVAGDRERARTCLLHCRNGGVEGALRAAGDERVPTAPGKLDGGGPAEDAAAACDQDDLARG